MYSDLSFESFFQFYQSQLFVLIAFYGMAYESSFLLSLMMIINSVELFIGMITSSLGPWDTKEISFHPFFLNPNIFLTLTKINIINEFFSAHYNTSMSIYIYNFCNSVIQFTLPSKELFNRGYNLTIHFGDYREGFRTNTTVTGVGKKY